MVAIAQRGGACLVQDFDDALYESMPRAAALAVADARRVPVRDMGKVLGELVRQPAPGTSEPSSLMSVEADMAGLDPDVMHDPERPGVPSGFACPDCHGALFEIADGPLTRFRCRVGHAWSSESLAARQSNDLESALWMGLRSLEEKAALSLRLASEASGRGHALTQDRFRADADEATRAAELLRELIARLGDGGSEATA
jgi:two-component system chemotaxis response regulator CheB